jgi:hypothetical protein
LPDQIESLIVRLKQEKPHWGARKIRELLVRRLDGDRCRRRTRRAGLATGEEEVTAAGAMELQNDTAGLEGVGDLGRRRPMATVDGRIGS